MSEQEQGPGAEGAQFEARVADLGEAETKPENEVLERDLSIIDGIMSKNRERFSAEEMRALDQARKLFENRIDGAS